MRKIIAIGLTCLLLIGNTGITVGMHYCHGKVVESAVAYGDKDLSCAFAQPATSCDLSATLSKSRSCCQDEYHTLTTDESQLSQFQVTLAPLVVLFALATAYISPASAHHTIVFDAYSPPLPPTNRPALLQVFII